MTFEDFIRLAPKLMPLLPQIEKAIMTAQKVLADPDLRAALNTAKQVADIIEQEQKTSSVAPQPQVNGIENQ